MLFIIFKSKANGKLLKEKHLEKSCILTIRANNQPIGALLQ
jgi:hypothetical protein